MRREELYLQDIVEAADYIARFVAESGLSGFRESEMVRSAIVQKRDTSRSARNKGRGWVYTERR